MLSSNNLNHLTVCKQIIVVSPCGVMAKVIDRGLEVSEFELQSGYYIRVRTNTIEKGLDRLIPPAMG